MHGKPIVAKLINDTVVVPDIDDSRLLFAEFYGKPIGSDRPRPGEVKSPLMLDPLESVYLVEKNIVIIINSDNNYIKLDEIKEWAQRKLPRFKELYPIYKNLREAGLIVRSGLKYGSDFTVYREGPGIDHSPYIVHVYQLEHELDPVEIVKAGRLSHSVRKIFILSSLEKNRGRPVFLMFKWFKP